MKKRNYFIALFLTIFLAFGLTSCKGCDNDDGGQEITVTLSETILEIEEYEQATLVATVTGTNETVVWESTESSIATVDNGIVTALKVGSTTITASVGEKQASCSVNVVATTYVPTISLSHESTTLRTDDTLNVSAVVRFKNEIQNVAVTWTSEKETIATVENGVITAIGVGETKIFATAECMGRTIRAEMIVCVHDDVEIDVNATSVVLKTDATIDPEYTQFTIIPTAKVNNLPYQGDFEITVEDNSIVSEEAGVLSALKAGETVVYVSITTGGRTYSQAIDVVVEKSEKITRVNQAFETYSGINSDNQLIANTLEIPLSEGTVLADTATLVDNDTERDVSINMQENTMQISGTEIGSDIYGEVKIYMETETHKLVYLVDIVTKYIRTAEDFNAITVYGNINENYDYNGLFELECDIELPCFTYTLNGVTKTETFWSVQRSISNVKDGSSGFQGVFDGKGYQISFRDWGWHNEESYGGSGGVYHNGLFGNVASGAVIKNLGISADIYERWTWSSVGILADCFAGTLENCNIIVYSSKNIASYVGLARSIPGAKFVDCMLWLDLYNTVEGYATSQTIGPYATSYLAYSYDARKAPSFENMIVVINASQSYDGDMQTWEKRETNPFRDQSLSDLGIEGVTEYTYTEDFSLEDVKGIENFKTENKKYWRTLSREVLLPQVDGTWGGAQSFTHLTMAGGSNSLWDEVGLKWSDKWKN